MSEPMFSTGWKNGVRHHFSGNVPGASGSTGYFGRFGKYAVLLGMGLLVCLPAQAAVTIGGGTVTNTYTIGTRTANVDITSVTGAGPWTVQLAAADLSTIAVNDTLADEAPPAKAWKISAGVALDTWTQDIK